MVVKSKTEYKTKRVKAPKGWRVFRVNAAQKSYVDIEFCREVDIK